MSLWRKHFLLAGVPLAASSAPFGILVLKAATVSQFRTLRSAVHRTVLVAMS